MKFTLAALRQESGILPVIEVSGKYYRISDIAPELIRNPERGILDLLEAWESAEAVLVDRVATLSTSGVLPIADPATADFAAPILYPSKVICTGTNYYDHLRKDMGIMDFDKSNHNILYFMKHQRAVVGCGPSVRHPSQSQMLDWEVELVVVIGKRGRRISQAAAMDHIAGYAIGIDLSARDWQLNPRHLKKFDLLAGKSFDDSAPLGPLMVPARFVDPNDLTLKLSVNGKVRQDSHVREMIWSISEQISELSQHMTLEPGDVIYTGSPDGVGYASKTFLQVGDRVDAEISGLGSMSIEIIADPDASRAISVDN